MKSVENSELTYIQNLQGEIAKIQPDSIISRTVLNNDHLKVVLFGFAAGQELSEHTASMPAILHILHGESHLKLGEEERDANAGSWMYMPAKLSHSVYAKTQLIMLLTLLKVE